MTKRGDDGNETLGNRQRDEQRIERATEGNRDENRMFGGMGKGETRMGERGKGWRSGDDYGSSGGDATICHSTRATVRLEYSGILLY